MKSITKPLVNTLTLAATLFVNYKANTGAINGKTVGGVSDQYPTMITPADYAFSIWGLIYLMLLAFVGYQWYQWYTGRHASELNRGGYWLAVANIANGAWVVLWLFELTGLSVVVMLLLLFALVRLVVALNMERWDAPLDVIVFIWWPVTIYLGWIILATVANFAAFFASIGWHGAPIGEPGWAIVMLLLATGIYIFLTYARSMREASFVGIWGLIAIAVKHWALSKPVAYAAVAAALVLLITAGYQGFKNRKVSAWAKLRGASGS